MIERVGLLFQGLEELISLAFEIYSNWEYAGQPSQNDSCITISEAFKSTFLREISIEFMGLWDSINSIGIFTDRIFPYTATSGIVNHIRHAVSIDERRAKYRPVLFETLNVSQEESSACTIATRSPCSSSISKDVLEVWFAGNHGDVGGGWTADKGMQCLSDVLLRWMLAEVLDIRISNYIKFKPRAISNFNLDHPLEKSILSYHHDVLSFKKPVNPINKYKHKKPRYDIYGEPTLDTDCAELLQTSGILCIPLEYNTQSEMSSLGELIDTNINSMTPLISKLQKFDARGEEKLRSTIFWWMLELLPLATKRENKNGRWKRKYMPNFGKRRKIPPTAKIHWSVYQRIDMVDDYDPVNLPSKEEDISMV